MMRPLLLSGFMATGKSVVGRLLAEQHTAQFFDLDAMIEEQAGKTIAELFRDNGEDHFRRLERDALNELLGKSSSHPTVISLGGGALLDRTQRLLALQKGVVVTLTADVEVILQRAQQQDGSAGQRPLLMGDNPEQRIRRLLNDRHLAYCEAHATVNTNDKSPAALAAQITELWQRDPVAVAAGEDSYAVTIGSGLITPLLARLVGKTSSTLLVTDTTVSPLHGDKARAGLSALQKPCAETILTPGEEHKNLQALSAIFDQAFEAGIDRSSTFVGLGGGVVTDMTGFAAASWMRGVRWIGLPTTLLSMVDASVGGKTAVDYRTAKNSVGAFWQPSGVICDIETLQTEKDRAYTGALSEVVKTALIGDPFLLGLLEENADAILQREPSIVREIVDRCVRVKARIVAADEREQGVRATLNLGHTIGHALESSGGYSALTHGEAVSLGLVAALRLGQKLGHTPSLLTERTLRLLKRLNLPHQLKRTDLEECTRLLRHDKKRAGGHIRFVYAAEPGNVFTESVQITDLVKWAPDLADD